MVPSGFLRLTAMLVSFHLTACFSLRSTPEELLDSVLDAAETSGVSRYPYLASLRAMSPGTGTSRHICGGALVGPSHVLVPASCLVDKVGPARCRLDAFVRVGFPESLQLTDSLCT